MEKILNGRIRGQLRHLMQAIGIFIVLYLPETKQDIFSLQWEAGVGVAFIMLALIDSWRTK